MDDLSAYLPWIAMAVNGFIAGFLASLLFGGGGIIRDIFVGILGAFVGGALVHAGIVSVPYFADNPWAHQILISTLGAILVILVARIIAR
jgi:uncharacterized membrane protein YeaQ/YmgE (transglycosylase-associated protein family)